jgi:hypothetical protein
MWKACRRSSWAPSPRSTGETSNKKRIKTDIALKESDGDVPRTVWGVNAEKEQLGAIATLDR